MLGQGGLGLPNLAALSITRALPVQNITVGLLDNSLVTVIRQPTLAFEAAQNIGVIRFDDSLTDAFYAPDFDVAALPGQILIQHFNDGLTDAFPAPTFALEAAQNVSPNRFDSGALTLLHSPAIFGEATDLAVSLGHFLNQNEFQGPTIVVSGKEPVYTYPIGRGLYSDYGIRASITNYKRRMIIGNRR